MTGFIFNSVKAGEYCPLCKSEDIARIVNKVMLNEYKRKYKIIDFSVFECNYCKAEFGIKNST